MAAPVYTSDLTTLIPDDSSTTSNWAAIGGGASGLNIETDYFIQGSSCVSKNAFANTTKGMLEDTTNTSLNLGDLDALFMWVTHATPGSLDTKANGGLRALLGSSGATYNEYYYTGSDEIDYGAPWLCFVVDPENATADSGTVTAANMDTYGASAKLVGGPTKGAPFGIDAIRQGRSYDITAGDSGSPATFTGMAADNDSQANRNGQFQGVPGVTGAFTMQCRVGFGTAATASFFDESNINVSLNNLEHVGAAFIEFEVINTGTTLKWTNVAISALGVDTKGNFVATSSLLIEKNTCTFVGMGTFSYDSNSTLDGCVYRQCETVTQNGATLTGNTFDDVSGGVTDNVMLLVDDLAKVTGNSFSTDRNGHAVDLGNITSNTTVTWDNTDTGYAAGSTGTDVANNPANGDETILCNVSASQVLTINIASGASIPSVGNAGTGTVDVVAGQTTLTIESPNGSEVRVKQGSYTLQHTQDVTGGQVTYTYTFAANTKVTITAGGSGLIRETLSYTLLASDATVTFSLEPDPSYQT